jgi:thiol-disulfide isomerase/thioredoxin
VYKETPSDSTREKLIDYAEQMTNAKNNEQNWINAMRVYRKLKMREKQKEIEDNILLYFPHGETAKENFWSTIYSNEEISTTAFLDSMQHYKTIFGDSSIITMDNFYLRLIYLNAKRKYFDTIFKYSGFVTDKLLLASAFNQIAWDLAGGGIDGKASNLDQASILSRSSIRFVQEKIKNNFVTDDPDELIGAHFYYTDTYALILYKQNKIDSAFYYESELWQTGLMEAAGMETYAIYSEKAKGLEFAKHFIETQLLNGIHSPVMLKQLDSIDQRLNISHNNYIKIEKINYLASKRKTSNEILERFGTIKSPSFRIKNLQGQYISLSDFRGKVIILDFWATWCGPCRESFPSMQELIKRYKGDKLVAFLFIDIWEQTDGEAMQARALKLINESNYDFNILLDEHNNVAESYKIRSIPTKVVIDKYGNIVYVGEGSGGLLEIIDNTRRH